MTLVISETNQPFLSYIKEEEGMKESSLSGLNLISNEITKETSKLNTKKLSYAMRTIPNMLIEHFSVMK